MDEKTKLYVFAKTEVALIFLFMLVIATTSFMFGVKVGRSYSYEASGLKLEDRERVDLLSGQEEKVNRVVEDHGGIDSKVAVKVDEFNKRLEERIKAELSEERKNSREKKSKKLKSARPPNSSSMPDKMVKPQEGLGRTPKTGIGNSKKDQYFGKHTIQIGSHRSLKEAKAFADGFRIRGYNPVINEVVLPNRGTWYRVSIGIFETITEAKDFMKKENSLFQDQDHIIVRFD